MKIEHEIQVGDGVYMRFPNIQNGYIKCNIYKIGYGEIVILYNSNNQEETLILTEDKFMEMFRGLITN